MPAMAPVPKDHPMMKAWEAHVATDDFANTKQWAAHEEHLMGSLWAVFVAGFIAGAKWQMSCGKCGKPALVEVGGVSESERGNSDCLTGQRAAILRIGGFQDDGSPVGWRFDLRGTNVPGIDIGEDGPHHWGGFTIDELRLIAGVPNA